MRIPVATCLFVVESGNLAGFVNRAAQSVVQDHIVEYDTEVIFVQLVDHLVRIRKNTRIPRERSVFGIPARGTKPRAQINESVAGKFFFAKRFGFREYFLAAGESAMRLLIAEAPERRHFCMPGQASVFGHNGGGLGGGDEKNVERTLCTCGLKPALRPSEIEGPEWLMDEN